MKFTIYSRRRIYHMILRSPCKFLILIWLKYQLNQKGKKEIRLTSFIDVFLYFDLIKVQEDINKR